MTHLRPRLRAPCTLGPRRTLDSRANGVQEEKQRKQQRLQSLPKRACAVCAALRAGCVWMDGWGGPEEPPMPPAPLRPHTTQAVCKPCSARRGDDNNQHHTR